MASESWSAFTLQATRSCAVEAATCLADEMSFSSLAWPCTAALAASHRLLVAAATMRACGERGCQGGYGSLPQGGYALTGPKEVVGHGMATTSFHAMSQWWEREQWLKKHGCFFHRGEVRGQSILIFAAGAKRRVPPIP